MNGRRLKKPTRGELLKKIFHAAGLSGKERKSLYYFSIRNLMELVLILERCQSKLRKGESDGKPI